MVAIKADFIHPLMQPARLSTEIHLMVSSMFGEIFSCFCSPAPHGPAWVLLAHHFVHLCSPQSLSGYPGHRANSQTKPKYNLAEERGRRNCWVVRAHSNLGRSAAVHRSALGRREGGRRCFGSFNQHLEPCFTNSPPPPRNSGGERERERERAARLGGGQRRGALLGR